MPKVILNHGAGGELMQQFLSDHITKHFPKMDAEVPLDSMDDSAVVDDIVFTIDGHTISAKLGTGIKFDESGNIVVDFTNTISSDADNAIKAGADGKLSVKVVSADGGNLIKTGTDKGALLTEADIEDSVTNIVNGMVDAPEDSLGCSIISETTGNQIQCDNGKLMVYSDYGTMDA